MTYHPMIKVTAEKFSEYWNGQALSDTIRCMSDGLVAFRAGDKKQLMKYIEHLRVNYDDYQEINEAGDYTVIRVYNWLCMAYDSLAKAPHHFSKKQIESYYDRWFCDGSYYQYGEKTYRWRKATFVRPFLRVIDSLVLQQDLKSLAMFSIAVESLNGCNLVDDEDDSITLFDISEYITNVIDGMEHGNTPLESIRSAREWLTNTSSQPGVAFSDFERDDRDT